MAQAKAGILASMDENPRKPVPLWAKVALVIAAIAYLAWLVSVTVVAAKNGGKVYEFEVIEMSEKKWEWP